MFLSRTIADILENIEADTEVIATMDGAWADPGMPQHDRVNLVYIPEPAGQRAATNLAAKLARGKYLMKVDAHCSFAKGFDRVMLEAFDEVGDDVTMVPIMRNLWAFDWKCGKCGSRWYQGPTPTRCMIYEGKQLVENEACNETKNFSREMVWKGKKNPQSWSYSFDSEPHFQYFEDWKHRPGIRDEANRTGFNETMSLQGSCFMATREKYWDLKLCDEGLGSWGNQGIEVACKTWLSGGRVLVCHRTWYAHMFRTQGGDFSFPYEQRGKHVSRTKKRTWQFFLNGNWGRQVHPVSWLVERFWPVPGWTQADLDELKAKEIRPSNG
jgi:hypothetical protein